MNKEYKCTCGLTFDNAQKFNGHKSRCKEHIESKGLQFDQYKHTVATKISNAMKSVSISKKEETEQLQKQKDTQWIEEKHTCEKCGKVMTEKFGSGRFCSRQCANSHKKTDESKLKVSKSIKCKTSVEQTQKLIEYKRNPSRCEICGKILPYEKRHRKSCSPECNRQLHSRRTKANPHPGGYRKGSGTGKHGYYKGYYCDSSYELAYVVYNLDHNINFVRNTSSYLYVDHNGKLHNYYPDFIENNEVMIEIKGYTSVDVYRKIAAVSNYPVKLLMYQDIKHMIDYVKATYNTTDITVLYE